MGVVGRWVGQDRWKEQEVGGAMKQLFQKLSQKHIVTSDVGGCHTTGCTNTPDKMR